MTAVQATEAQLVAEDVADLVTLAQERPGDDGVVAVVRRVLDRHRRAALSAVKYAHAARLLDVSRTTVQSWVERGVLEQVSGRPKRVSAVSLGQVLALVRQLGQTDEGRERLLRAIEKLRDRDLLTRARQVAEETGEADYIVYDQSALAELRGE